MMTKRIMLNEVNAMVGTESKTIVNWLAIQQTEDCRDTVCKQIKDGHRIEFGDGNELLVDGSDY
jgi:hypothetical protein